MKKTKIEKYLLILILIVFPLGQVPSLALTFLNPSLHVFQLLDILILVYNLISLNDKKIFKKFVNSWVIKVTLILIVGNILSWVFLTVGSSTSLLYLVRLITYLTFGYLVYKKRPLDKKTYLTFLIYSSLLLSITGLIQYIAIPDTRALKLFGWDDHYFRLIGTFLDPAFTGIVLVGLFFSLLFNKEFKNKYRPLILLLLLVSILLTYSRASYLALLVGVLVSVINFKKKLIKYFAVFLALLIALLLLPRQSSEGVNLGRTFSISLRAQNYIDTIKIWEKSPIWGVGFNNLCEVKEKYLDISQGKYISHSCSGADNSFLFLLATTGILGFSFGSYYLLNFLRREMNSLFVVLFASFGVHAFFSNTLFYPWIMVFLIFILGYKD